MNKIRVPDVLVGVESLRGRLRVAAAQGLGPDQRAAAESVRQLLDRAEAAARGEEPPAGRVLRDRWSGRQVEAAYGYLHAARTMVVDVFDDAEIAAEVPVAIARAQQTLHRDDPRRTMLDQVTSDSVALQRAFLRRTTEDSYDSLDCQHQRLRSFRNIILLLAMFIAALVVATVALVTTRPEYMPLCFTPRVTAAAPEAGNGPAASQICPTGSGVGQPQTGDVAVVALMGLLGGALAAAVSIRGLRGTSTPYDVPVALSLLKVPLGAFTAMVGLVAIRGEFVPGLSQLDSQQQILAYALVLGYAQQVFTFALDRRAQTLLESLPTKEPQSSAAAPVRHPQVPRQARPAPIGGVAPTAVGAGGTPPNHHGDPAIDLNRPVPVPAYREAPREAISDTDTVQDPGDPPAPSPPPEDHH